MEVDLHHEVRCQGTAVVVREGGDPQERGDAAHPRRVGLYEVGGARLDERRVLADAGQHLTGGDRGVQRRRERGMPLGVVGVERFLDPGEVEPLQHPAGTGGGDPVPLLVGVDHQRNAVAEVFADRLDPLEVDGRVR
ncbi:hypothetical protein M271_48830 [Streptomyces rapamycinicus NRRL 5491]|nr:hypothetical protein M271_48830 [Streptomyces rapamycinicus NRRL 5491]